MTASHLCPHCGGPRLPVVFWKDMVNIQEMDSYNKTFHALHAMMYLSEGDKYIHVFIKVPKTPSEELAETLRHEGMVLLRLQDLPGVPKLYGITKLPRVALVTEFISASPLGEFLTPQGVKIYIEALIRLSEVMDKVHAKGVAHLNIQQRHVFVEKTNSNGHTVMATAVGYHNAILNPTPKDLHKDIEAVGALGNELHQNIPSKNPMYNRRDLLLSIKCQYSFKDVLNILNRVLHGKNAPMVE